MRILDWLYCFIHGHLPVTTHEFHRVKSDGSKQRLVRSECFVCGRRMR